jgi:hypothetical protein
MTGSGLKIQDRVMADVLREAAEVEETEGMIRPVTLNLCGLVLSRFATGLTNSFRPGGLIRGFVHEALFQKDVKEASPILLPKLVSRHVTKRPCTIADLARDTSLTARQAQGAMFKLGAPEWGVVQALDPKYEWWEISHDFLVSVIDSMLAHWKVSLWSKVRLWLPLGYAALLLLALFVAPKLVPDLIAELNRLGWRPQFVDAKDPDDKALAKEGITYVLSFSSIPPRESVHLLNPLAGRFRVKLTHIPSFDTAHFGPWSGLRRLTELDLSSNDDLIDVSALEGMPQSLSTLDLSRDPKITDAALKNLPPSLTSLHLAFDDGITDAGLKGLPSTVKVSRWD